MTGPFDELRINSVEVVFVVIPLFDEDYNLRLS
jgi:hypothetical protein